MTAPRVPPLAPTTPARGRPVQRALGRALLALLRFRVTGTVPDVPRCVIIAAPHTSNWDFVVAMAALLGLDLRVTWLGKHTIFRGPLGALWRALGGVPVDRASPDDVVASAVALFTSGGPVYLALSPEGTRRRVERWKSGFWRIARAAGVPILPVALDYDRREVALFDLFVPTADYDQDHASLRGRFHARMARHPGQF